MSAPSFLVGLGSGAFVVGLFGVAFAGGFVGADFFFESFFVAVIEYLLLYPR
jgi:hypothetical protein